MIERPGATFALSLLILLVAALVLYRKEPPDRSAEAVAAAASNASDPTPSATAPAPTSPAPAVPVAATSTTPSPAAPPARVEPPRPTPEPAPVLASESAAVAAAAAGALVPAAAASAPPEPTPPQPTFGVAWPGGHDPVAAVAEPAPPSLAPPAGSGTVAAEPVVVPSLVGVRGATPTPEASASPTIGPAAESPPISRVPTTPLTAVHEGETLADVAERVYGSTRATHSLWQVNRDALDSDVQPLQAGMVLRTPPLSH